MYWSFVGKVERRLGIAIYADAVAKCTLFSKKRRIFQRKRGNEPNALKQGLHFMSFFIVIFMIYRISKCFENILFLFSYQ